MASIKFQISAVPSVDDYFIAVLYKTTAPTVEVARQVKAAPHNTPGSFNFTDLVPGEYIAIIYYSEDGVALGAIVTDWWAKAVNDNGLYEVFQFTVGEAGAPEDGEDEYINPALAGYSIDWIHGGNGVSFYHKNLDWEPTAEGFRLINGSTFIDQQKVTFQIQYTTETDTGPSLNPAFTEIITKGNTTTLLAGEANKWIRFISLLNAVVDCTLPDPSALNDGEGYLIECTRSAIKSLKVTAAIDYRGASITYIYLGPGEAIKLLKKDGTYIFHPVDSIGGWDRVGERQLTVLPVNTLDNYNYLLCDRSPFSGLTYRRIYEYILSLPPGQRVSFGDAAENTTKRTLWSVNTTTQQFKTPDRRGIFQAGLRNIGSADTFRPDNFPGGFQAEQIGNHTHGLPADDVPGPGIDTQSIVRTPNSDEGPSETFRTTGNNPNGINVPDNEGLHPVVCI